MLNYGDPWDNACLHGVSDQGWIFETVFVDERCDILGHGYVVMARDVRRFTMIPKILAFFQYGSLGMDESEHSSPEQRHISPNHGLIV